jgi:2-C-methyl-D-erythritol 4-phosphate cytidylyltransferase/2-C-methyl-D-erythritol 2,4-cyclodiphosphate synthase
MSVGAIIVAAGRGARIGGATPKQLLDIGGRTILQRSVAAFDGHAEVSEIVVVLPAEWVTDGAALIGPTARRCHFAAGGERRQDSVARGLAAMPAGPDLILVHDAARPFAGRELIDRVIAAAAEHGAAVPAVAARDTVKRLDVARRTVRETIPREEIWLAQTPQGFRRDVLAAAVAAGGADATDEASLAERAGHPVRVVDGDEQNMKITTPGDLESARARLSPARVGTGYDLHRLVEGRPLCLAGVVVPFERRWAIRTATSSVMRSPMPSLAPRRRETSASISPTPTRAGRTRPASSCCGWPWASCASADSVSPEWTQP